MRSLHDGGEQAAVTSEAIMAGAWSTPTQMKVKC